MVNRPERLIAILTALADEPGTWYGSRISLADQGRFGVTGEPGAFVEPP
jgi:hypothetical protein